MTTTTPSSELLRSIRKCTSQVDFKYLMANTQSRSEEWCKQRALKSIVTASNVATVMGASQYSPSRYTYWEIRAGHKEKSEVDPYSLSIMQRGIDEEPVIRRVVARALAPYHFLVLGECGLFRRGHLGATPDGFVVDRWGNVYLLEVKRRSRYTEKPPIEHLLQCVTQIYCAGDDCRGLFYAVCTPESESEVASVAVWFIERDAHMETFIREHLLPKTAEFVDQVIGTRPPPAKRLMGKLKLREDYAQQLDKCVRCVYRHDYEPGEYVYKRDSQGNFYCVQ